MGPVSAEITIDARREDVFALLLDMAARPAFTDHFLDEFHLLRVEPSGVGAGARFRIDGGPRIDTVIVEATRPHRIVERGRGGYLNGIANVTEWRLSELPGPSGCEVALTFMTQPESPLDKVRELGYSQRRLKRGWRRALERLRALAESDEPPARLIVAGGDRMPA